MDKRAARPRESGAGDADALRSAARRRRVALVALLFPLLFFVVIAIGLIAMKHGRDGMEFFKPAPSSDG